MLKAFIAGAASLLSWFANRRVGPRSGRSLTAELRRLERSPAWDVANRRLRLIQDPGR